MRDIEKKLVFGVSASAHDGSTVIIIGIPRAAFEEMKDGKTQPFDLRKVGYPIQVIVYGAETHDEALKPIQQQLACEGKAYLDMRDKDFTP